MVLLYLHRVLIPAAVIPAIFLLVKIYRADRREKEPPAAFDFVGFLRHSCHGNRLGGRESRLLAAGDLSFGRKIRLFIS